jgi:hypothetical protein
LAKLAAERAAETILPAKKLQLLIPDDSIDRIDERVEFLLGASLLLKKLLEKRLLSLVQLLSWFPSEIQETFGSRGSDPGLRHYASRSPLRAEPAFQSRIGWRFRFL